MHVHLTHTAIVRGEAPEGKFKTAVVGLLSLDAVENDMAAFRVPARSAIYVKPGGEGFENAPTPSTASPER